MTARSFVSPDDAKRQKGVIFDMKGGPYDGSLLRLYPGRYAPPAVEDGGNYIVHSPYDTKYRGTEGWDSLPAEGGRYVIGEGIDPFMDKKKANKARTNIPHMVWEAEAEQLAA